jgi:hypothetical protein
VSAFGITAVVLLGIALAAAISWVIVSVAVDRSRRRTGNDPRPPEDR